jgi:VanZ family protein
LDKKRRFAIATAIVAAVIIYGSLYPFQFRPPVDGIGSAVHALFESRTEPFGRTTFVANILLYLPLGFCAILALKQGHGTAGRVLLVTLTGALLSVSVELTQYFDAGRVTDAPDVVANTLGTLAGAIGGSLSGGSFRLPLLAEIAANRVPTLLLAAWIGYRLYPFVPTIDLHKYWDALKPVIFHPSLTGYDLFRYTAIWLTISTLIEAIVGPRRMWVLFALFIGAVLAGKVMIVDATLRMDEVAGAGSAVVCRAILGFNTTVRIALIALAFCGYVIAERLEPFQFHAHPVPFRWIPFVGFMSGDLEIDVMAFLEKFFLYGGAIWLLTKAGLRLRNAVLLMTAVLFVTSQAERFLPNRSAEVTDAIMALMIGAIFALIGETPNDTNTRAKRISRGVGGG